MDAKIENSDLNGGENAVSFRKILLTYSDITDKILIVLGYCAAVAAGFGLPLFTYLLGDITDAFSPSVPADESQNSIQRTGIILACIGTFLWFTTYIFFTFLTIVSERIGQKTKIKYLEAILRQDIAWFD